MKIFLDTNIILCFFVPENERMFSECQMILNKAINAELFVYTSNVVLLEYHYVITKTYHQTKVSVLEDIERILQIRNIRLIEKTHMVQALTLYKMHHIKFGDCLIATQMPMGVTLCTYDTDFSKIPSLTTMTPAEVLMQLAK